jgi:hypothetical protein
VTGFRLDAALDDASRFAFSTLFGTAPAVLHAFGPESLVGPLDRVAVVDFHGRHAGALAFLCTEPLARRLVQRMLLTDDSVDDATIRDGVGEITNCLAGAVKRLFIAHGNPFDLSVPACLEGAAALARLGTSPDWVGVRLCFDHEVFLLAARLHGPPAS